MQGLIQIQDILIQGKHGQRGDTYHTPVDSDVSSDHRVRQVVELIHAIAAHAQGQHTPNQITRAITDEFSFYTEKQAFTVDEYKAIIHEVALIAKDLRADVHLVLATFPVIWPDGGIHNCGLYVESPKAPDELPTIHHFSKHWFAAGNDYTYLKSDGSEYPLTSDKNCSPEQLPETVLVGTEVSVGDLNQYKSALNITTSDGKGFLVSLGICIDHAEGVEREQGHGLIEQLQTSGHGGLPLHCSHVITSGSAGSESKHVLSTLSHADTQSEIRQKSNDYPGRAGFISGKVSSNFSGELTTETYPPKLIGTVHSDLFQHIAANQADVALAETLNQAQDEAGNTLLHQVLLETHFDTELMAKRLYIMILNGADPDCLNARGESVRALVEAGELGTASKEMGQAIYAALEHRSQFLEANQVSSNDRKTALTRALSQTDLDEIALKNLVLSGANPYLKDGLHQSAMDIIERFPPEKKEALKDKMKSWQLDAQYSYKTFPEALVSQIYQARARIQDYRNFREKVQTNTVTSLDFVTAFEALRSLDEVLSADALGQYKSTMLDKIRAINDLDDSVENNDTLVGMRQTIFNAFMAFISNHSLQLEALRIIVPILSQVQREEAFNMLMQQDFHKMISQPSDIWILKSFSPEQRSEVLSQMGNRLHELYTSAEGERGLRRLRGALASFELKETALQVLLEILPHTVSTISDVDSLLSACKEEQQRLAVWSKIQDAAVNILCALSEEEVDEWIGYLKPCLKPEEVLSLRKNLQAAKAASESALTQSFKARLNEQKAKTDKSSLPSTEADKDSAPSTDAASSEKRTPG